MARQSKKSLFILESAKSSGRHAHAIEGLQGSPKVNKVTREFNNVQNRHFQYITCRFSSFRAKIVLSGEQYTRHQLQRQTLGVTARARAQQPSPRARAPAPLCPGRPSACMHARRHCHTSACRVRSSPVPAHARQRLPVRSTVRSSSLACLTSCCACARQLTPNRMPLFARTYITLHPNVLTSVQTSHPTLKPFPESFLTSRG
ncbi:hypothetical protein CRG98_037604 [Punica granatum]|uniref:Uncharacterized protein n=1 Tax=Punica granatum TaxID=22663 RepID=A0A2I0IF53_PUNGR|nr:hypothetical protein CRG98_037604 [Punica granatum]